MAMQVELEGDLRMMVRAKVAAGLYGDEKEVVRDALRMMMERDRFMAFCEEEGSGEFGALRGRRGETLFVEQ